MSLSVLPPEILRLIFDEVLIPSREDDSHYVKIYRRSTLALISRHFHAVVIQIAAYRNSFVIDRFTSASYVEQCLSNSGFLPISVEVHHESYWTPPIISSTGIQSRPNEGEDGTRFSTNIIHTVASHSSRLHTLLLRSEKYSDMVDMLQIFFGFHTPMLSDFHCFVAPFGDIGPVPTHFPMFNAPLRNMMLASLPEFAVIPGVLSSLTSLELHGTREPGILWRQLAPALRAAVNLERLMLAQVDCHKINGGPIVTLPSLRHFTLVYGDHRCGSVARNMDMPSLEALTLMVVGEAELSSFLNSNPKIFDVAVRYKLALRQRSSRQLHLALEKMSSAEFLDLRSSDDDVTDTMVKMASTGVPALPHLHTLLLPLDVPSTKAASIVNGRIGTELTVIIPNPDYDRPYSRWRYENGAPVEDSIPRVPWGDIMKDYLHLVSYQDHIPRAN